MNISEANATNRLIRWVLGQPDIAPVSDNDAMKAAELLADRANHALSAGLTAADIRAAWNDRHRPHAEKSGTVICIPCLEPWPCPTVRSREAWTGALQ